MAGIVVVAAAAVASVEGELRQQGSSAVAAMAAVAAAASVEAVQSCLVPQLQGASRSTLIERQRTKCEVMKEEDVWLLWNPFFGISQLSFQQSTD